MISRRSTLRLAEGFVERFSGSYALAGHTSQRGHITYSDAVFDWLYERDYESWFCNAAKKVKRSDPRGLKEFIMGLQTGDTIRPLVTWTESEIFELGQSLLTSLAQDVLKEPVSKRYETGWNVERIKSLSESLALDGHVMSNGHLLCPEADVLDTQEITGVLHTMYSDLGLADFTLAFHHLELSEEHYLNHKWDDSISNSRKFLETVLKEIARKTDKAGTLGGGDIDRPVKVREFMESQNLLEKRERETLDKVYALLSQTGGHPYMAASDQARLLRNMALTFAQFVMIRAKGSGLVP